MVCLVKKKDNEMIVITDERRYLIESLNDEQVSTDVGLRISPEKLNVKLLQENTTDESEG